MSVRVRRWIYLCLFFLLALPDIWAFFGLTAREPLATLSWEVQDNVMGLEKLQHQRDNSGNGGGGRNGGGGGGRGGGGGGRAGVGKSRPLSPRQLCKLLKLHRRQARMCRRGKGIPQTLIKATRMSVLECQHQFKYERWNCSLGQYRQKILQKGTKETSFLYAISSAGLVHEFARACSQGTLDRCTCDESDPVESKKTWLWGGCGDNIRFGVQFTRRFLKKAHKSGKDIRAKVDQHNSRVGIKVVKNQVNTTCKCHGVSGSCTVKTCWLQLAPFHSVGNILKHKYEQSVQAFSHTNKATGKTHLSKRIRDWGGDRLYNSNMTALRRGELAYIEESPSFCRRSRYSPGTSGRICSKDGSCDSICCGRGYNVQQRRVKRVCNCEVFWCCELKCQECTKSEEIYMCK
ncbi:protein Wnt-9a-like [Littorina saxatilis]|uniref:protein Wnt-9a-like n=1 Tax=Littorina saxatilis TaxID=31220 RepID=UPI0038B5FEB1